MTTQRVDAGSTGATAAVRRLPVLDRQLSDPAGRTVAGTRPIRDEIDARVRTMLTELVPEPSV